MNILIETVVELFKSNIKRPALWLVLIIMLSLSTIILPYIDHYFFFYDRTGKRVELLEQISSLNMEDIAKDERLLEEYNSIIDDIHKQGKANLLGLDAGTLFIPTTKSIQFWKFASGASLLWMLALCVPFMNTFDNKSSKVGAFFIVLICGAVTGFISCIIPTFYIPKINYFIIPALLIAIMVIALIKSNKKKSKE